MAIAANGSKAAAEKPGRRLRIPLSLKFATATAALVLLLLSLFGALSLWTAYGEAERASLDAEQQRAEALAGHIGGVMAELQNQLAWTAQPAWKNAGVEQQRADFTRMLQQFPAINELLHIDGKGIEQLKVSRFAPDSVASRTNHASEPRFVETVKARTWFGPVYVRNGSELAATIGIAHADGGVSVAELDLSFVGQMVGAAQADGLAFVVDRTGRLIAYPGRNPVTSDTDLSALPLVAAALAADGTGIVPDAVTEAGAPAFAAHAAVPGAGWRVLAETPRAEAMAPFNALAWRSALLLAAGTLIAAAAGIWQARRVAGPIERLQAGAERLGEGDLTQRVAIRRRDEIGALADRFNTMASRLQQGRMGLEARIDDNAVGLDIALQQQALTADMLKTISRSDYELEPVLDTLIGSAVRLTEANVGAVWLRDGDTFRLAAQLGHASDWVEAARKTPLTAGSDTHAVAAAAAYSGQLINVDDVSRDLRFMGDYGERPTYGDERSALAVPLKHGGRVEAVFSLSRADPIAFTERQAAIAQDFADQGLIAIRNHRLLDKVAARDSELAQSYDQQAATGSIARAVAQSADIQPVLDTIAERAARLCNAPYCHIELFDGQLLHFRAQYGLEAVELIGGSFPAALTAGSLAERAITSREPALVADLQAESGGTLDELAQLLGIRSAASFPLLRNGAAIGVMTVADPRPDVLPAFLKDRRLALLKTVADQAAVALDSARLSDELSLHASRLAAALDREAATGGLLQAVSRTDFDLDAMLSPLARRIARECAADETQLFRLDGGELRPATADGATAEGHASLARRVVAKAAAINMLDAWQDPDHAGKDAAARSMLGLPLLAKGKVVGAVTLSRGQVLPFDEKQAEIAAALADQAGLAVAGTQLPQQLAERTAERDEWRQRHAADVEAEERQHAAEMDETRRSHAAEAYEARRLHAAELDQTTRRFEAELTEARTLHADELAERTAERDEWRQRHATDTEAAEQRRVAEIDEARRLHADEVEEISRQHTAATEDSRQRHEAELAEAHRQHAEELKETVETRAAELAETIAAYTGQLDEARQLHSAELDEARRLHATEIAEARRLHTDDVDLARLQHAATAEALKRVADPSAGLDAALQAIVRSAVNACSANAGVLFTKVGDWIKAEVTFGLPGEEHEATLAALRDAVATEVIAQGKSLHIGEIPAGGAAFGALCIPLLKDGAAQGALVLIGGAEPFGEERAALAESFADQATIAIETERLVQLASLRASHLDEAMRFREAAARVLDLVASVGTDPQQALDALVATAAELCAAQSVELSHVERDEPRVVAATGTESPDSGAPAALLTIPLTLDGRAAGSLTLRREAAFSEREIDLANTLAVLAAVAIAKARLAVALAERNQSLDHALAERQATAHMLATIGRSRIELDAVLAILARSAADLCGAGMAAICLDTDGALECAGSVGFPAGWLADGRYLQAAGVATRAMREASPMRSSVDAAVGNMLAAPLLAAGGTIGALVIARPAPFGDADVAMVETLADQATIAVESVRLLRAVEARTAEVHERVRQQAAAADMLGRISRAPFELDEVLPALAASAASLCNAGAAGIYLLKGGAYHLGAVAGASPEPLPRFRVAARDSWIGRAALDKTVVHVPDVSEDEQLEATAGVSAVLCAPLLREGEAIGVFALTRPEPGPFGEQQIGLVRSFADQAVIAIETVRLAEEVHARTAEVSDAARQQTAIADLLKTISRSEIDLDAVLTRLTASAASLCNAGGAAILMLRDGAYRLGAATGAMPAELVRDRLPGRDSWIGRAALEGTVIHVADTGRDAGHPEIAGIGGVAAILCVPLVRDGAAVGVFVLSRSEPGPFSERQIGLVRTFADQAVIAAETVRLAEEAEAHSGKLAALLQDLRSAQARLLQTERLASLGQLTAGIAGEIEERLKAVNDVSRQSNKQVDAIRMVLEAAVIDGDTRAEVEELADTLKASLDQVVEHGRRADSVVRNMLLNWQEESGGHRPVDINAIVDESLGLAWHGARAEREDFDISLEKRFDPQAGKVDLYPQEITRVLTNLISNGFYATARRGAEVNGTPYRPVLAASTKNLGNAVEIRIRDNGTGIPAEEKAKLFTPFFTTKPSGEGTGLGLSQSRDIIVRKHSGTIDVETMPGSFTEFRIVLPRDGASLTKPEDGHERGASFEARPQN